MSINRVDVVVTGLGTTTPLGGGVASTWAGMLAGRSGVSALTEDWAAPLPVRIAARLAVDPADVLDRVTLRQMDRSTAIALIAARQAWQDSGLTDCGPEPDRLAVSIGSGIGGIQSVVDQNAILEKSGPRKVSLYATLMAIPNSPAARVGVEFGARAGVHAVTSACATGAEAIALGLDIIRSGRADVVVAGGTEAAVGPLPIAGFAAIRALSRRNDEPERASRPWDKGREGFVLGEGAGVMILERADHAAARGARIYAHLAGAGITSDGHDVVQPHPQGRGVTAAVTAALTDSGVGKSDVAHVNAHATGTPIGDMAEIMALRSALGEHPVLSATKSMTGHLLGAAGAVESIATVLALHNGVAPPTINLDDPEAGLTMDVAIHEPRRVAIGAALNNSFGFGGHNVALLFTR
jgi:3-oxoacyl-[acyl-carrier-protein] synthase II